ncbi:MAG: hypothetical protein ACI8S6_005411, partial [Myxococcota bacterium]
GQQSEDTGPGRCTSRWLHEQKAALKFQSAAADVHVVAPITQRERQHGLHVSTGYCGGEQCVH